MQYSNYINDYLGIPAVPHLSCIGDTRASLRTILDTYKGAGIQNIVTLRGDLPNDMDDVANEFHYADELVTFICHMNG